jgi:hypothetical protein
MKTFTENIRESEIVAIKEYNEMLYSKDFIQKQSMNTFPEKKKSINRLRWESLGTIERKIDAMKCTQTDLKDTRNQISNDINQKVDCILSQNKTSR